MQMHSNGRRRRRRRHERAGNSTIVNGAFRETSKSLDTVDAFEVIQKYRLGIVTIIWMFKKRKHSNAFRR